jgi:DNA-binding SARP family transcriptional activator/tetratricopeptide (TPR) repeat protein
VSHDIGRPMRIKLALLGELKLSSPSGRPVEVSSRKGRALLAYLGLQPGTAVPRASLAALLWPGAPAARARQSLRQTLVALRQAVPGTTHSWLRDDGPAVSLRGAAVDVDVEAFEREAAVGTPAALARAAALYRGEVCDGLDVDGTQLRDWLAAERERFRERAVAVLAKLLEHQLGTAPADVAIQTAVRLLALDPAREAAHRALMGLHAREGRRTAALGQYQLCVATLERERGIEPGAETRRLYQEILQHRLAPTAPPATAARPGRSEASRLGLGADALASAAEFIGRETELDVLGRAWDEARQGRARVVTLLGEAGVGKTRLVLELARRVSRSEGTVLMGHAYESTQVLPFGPWIEALRTGRVLDPEGLVQRLDPAWRTELARLFPELGPSPAAVSPENSLRLFEALARLIGEVVARGPLLLGLEDLHWSDEASLRFLGFLARRVGTGPLLLVMTLRVEDVFAAPLLGRLLEELRREERLVTLPVPALSRKETEALVRALTRTGGVASLLEQVWTISEGNPFTVVEAVRELGSAAVPPGGRISLPARARALVARHLEHLGPRSRELVGIAAVSARGADFGLLRTAAGQVEAEAAEAVEELVRRRVFVRVGEGFDFAHDRLRTVAYEGLLPARRQFLHGAVAQALEAAHAGSLDRVADRLAYHHARSAQPQKAVPHLSVLAAAAARGYAHVEAVAVLREAAALLERGPAEDRDRRIVELMLREAFSLSVLGRFREVRDLVDRERPRVERLADPGLTAQYAFRLAMTHVYLGDHDTAARHAERALQESARCGDDALLGMTHYAAALGGYAAGRGREGIEHARRAIPLLEATGEQYWLGLAHFVDALSRCLLGEFAGALASATCADRIGEAIGDGRLRSFAAFAIGLVHVTRGEWQEGIAWCQRSLDLSVDPIGKTIAQARLGCAYVEGGEPERAIPLLEEAMERVRQFGVRAREGDYGAFLAEAWLARGDLPRARALAEESLTLLPPARFSYSSWRAERTLGRIARAEGALAETDARLARALAGFEAVEAALEAGRTRLDLAEVAHARGEAATAAGHLTAAHRAFISLQVPRYVERAAALARRLGVVLAHD